MVVTELLTDFFPGCSKQHLPTELRQHLLRKRFLSRAATMFLCCRPKTSDDASDDQRHADFMKRFEGIRDKSFAEVWRH